MGFQRTPPGEGMKFKFRGIELHQMQTLWTKLHAAIDLSTKDLAKTPPFEYFVGFELSQLTGVIALCESKMNATVPK